MKDVIRLIWDSEGWLMQRVLEYADAHDYTKYTSAPAEVWRRSIAGLSASLIEGMQTFDDVPELRPGDSSSGDPMAQLGIIEVQRHRKRGVSLPMFLGLMKYFRQGYLDLIDANGGSPSEVERRCLFLRRCFDRIEIAFCEEWMRNEHSDMVKEIVGHKQTQAELHTYRDHLETLVRERTTELSAANARLAEEIDEHKRAEQALQLLSSALEAAANAVVITDRDGQMIWVNPAFTRLTGYEREEVIGKNPRFLKSGQHDDSLYSDMWKTILTGEVWQGDLVNRRKDGSLYTEEMTITPVRDRDGKISHFIAIKLDATERKHAQETLAEYADSLEETNMEVASAHAKMQEALAELARKNAELDEFTYVASHDLQEPIRKLISFGQLLRVDVGGDLSENAAMDLDFITDAAERMQALVQDLLRLSRAGQSAMRQERVSLAACADRAMDALAARAEETGARITRAPLPDVVGDATLLTQLYQNLIGNALKFAAPGRVPEVELTAEERDGHWVLGVRDNGIGIAAEYAEQVFAPFRRLHGRSEYEGSGIGLSICRKAVERHGGLIWIESESGRGAHFRFVLATHEERDAPAKTTTEHPSCPL